MEETNTKSTENKKKFQSNISFILQKSGKHKFKIIV